MSLVPSKTLAGAAYNNTGYRANRSLRFRASATAYLNRTPASASNRTTWTWSGWVKLGKLGTYRQLFSAGSGATQTGIDFESGDTLYLFSENGSGTSLRTSQLFRDPSAWYHIIWAVDTTQATAANRSKLYVNGSQVTAFSYTQYAAQNTQSAVNNTVAHYISTYDGSGWPMDGCMAEVNFIDGQQLTPSSFGQTNSITGAWQPIKYTGTYGTNGFYLPFTNTTSTTTIGYDSSGNGNNWTTNNISLTAGATYDSMTDVPTLTSATAANFCTMNPLYVNSGGSGTYTNGNLTFSIPNNGGGIATFSLTSGKWYWEVVSSSNPIGFGVRQNGTTDRYTNTLFYENGGQKYVNGTATSYGASWTTGDVIGIALDCDSGTVTFYKNNASQGALNLSLASITDAVPAIPSGGGAAHVGDINFGQRPFAYTPPTGYKALNTFNLPDPTIKKPNQYMDATLYTGNGTTQSIVNAAGFQPDLVWIKARSTTTWNSEVDSVRGVTKILSTNSTGAEATNANTLTAFNSNGFSIGSETTWNDNGQTFVGWQWQAGKGTTSSNTSGTITSTVSVNQTAGFSVVTWTGTGVNNATVGHGLGVAPSLIIVKDRTLTYNWDIYHKSLGITATLTFTSNGTRNLNAFGTNAPTSSVFSTYDTFTNTNGSQLVAYCWSAIPGYSAFGTYTGNGDSDGPFVFCGFKPRFILAKPTDSSNGWFIWDTARDTYNVATHTLSPNASDAEQSAWYNNIDVVSNGFKVRSYGYMNGGGVTYIYAAFAENPFKYANAR